MSVITFASHKGGAGKTTSAIVTATTLSKQYRVAFIDADPARRALAWASKKELPENMTVIASEGERAIHREIHKESNSNDYVILDLEGAATRLNAHCMRQSDLVIIPMADERPDADAAIETISTLLAEAKACGKDIPMRVLFARTKAAVKSRLARSLNEQVRNNIGAFTTELHERTAFSSLHNLGGTLYDMDTKEVSGVEKAIGNAERFTQELEQVMTWVEQIRSGTEKANKKTETPHV